MNKACLHSLSWLTASASLCLAASPVGVELVSSDQEPPEPKRPEIVVSYMDPLTDEDDSARAVAETLGLETRTSYGVERLYWENSEDSDWRIFLDSRLMVRPDNYSVDFEATKMDEKYFRLRFDFAESYESGSGIYYPDRDALYLLDPDILQKELMKVTISYRFLPSSESSWEIGYSFLERTGDSLSTRFGDDYQYQVVGRPRSRGIVPALSTGKERVHTVDFTYKQQDEVDRKGFRLHAQRRESDQSRITERGAATADARRFSRHEEGSKDDLLALSAFRRKQLTDNMYGSLGFVYTRMDGDITGSRVFGANPESSYDIDFVASQLDDRGFLDLETSRQLRQWVVNANLVYDPEANHRWMAGVRFERLFTKAFSSYIDPWDTFDILDLERQSQESQMASTSDKDANDLSGFLEYRYKGMSKAQFFTRLEVGFQDGNLSEDWSSDELSPNSGSLTLLDRANKFDRERLFVEAGLNYYPSSNLRISVQGYIKSRENEYDFTRVLRPGVDFTAYPGFIEQQEFYTEDINARVHWKIFSWLKSVTRVDLQYTTIDSLAYGKDTFESAQRERMVFNQGIVITPHPRLFINASYQLVDDLTETAGGDLEAPFDGIIVNIPNDYWQVDVNVFYVLTKKIDLQLGYYYLEMSNYLDTSPATVAYGSDVEQHRASGSIIFRLSESMTARVGYHYYEQTDLSKAGADDYSIHLLKTSLQRKF